MFQATKSIPMNLSGHRRQLFSGRKSLKAPKILFHCNFLFHTCVESLAVRYQPSRRHFFSDHGSTVVDKLAAVQSGRSVPRPKFSASKLLSVTAALEWRGVLFDSINYTCASRYLSLRVMKIKCVLIYATSDWPLFEGSTGRCQHQTFLNLYNGALSHTCSVQSYCECVCVSYVVHIEQYNITHSWSMFGWHEMLLIHHGGYRLNNCLHRKLQMSSKHV